MTTDGSNWSYQWLLEVPPFSLGLQDDRSTADQENQARPGIEAISSCV
jgi:hypothetical protein